MHLASACRTFRLAAVRPSTSHSSVALRNRLLHPCALSFFTWHRRTLRGSVTPFHISAQLLHQHGKHRRHIQLSADKFQRSTIASSTLCHSMETNHRLIVISSHHTFNLPCSLSSYRPHNNHRVFRPSSRLRRRPPRSFRRREPVSRPSRPIDAVPSIVRAPQVQRYNSLVKTCIASEAHRKLVLTLSCPQP